jgi:hypothetical protein
MAIANDTGPTLFQRLAHVRASLVQALAETKSLRDAIVVPDEEGDAREQAIDLRLQVARAARELEELTDDPHGPYVPDPEHIDQTLPLLEVRAAGRSS